MVSEMVIHAWGCRALCIHSEEEGGIQRVPEEDVHVRRIGGGVWRGGGGKGGEGAGGRGGSECRAVEGEEEKEEEKGDYKEEEDIECEEEKDEQKEGCYGAITSRNVYPCCKRSSRKELIMAS